MQSSNHAELFIENYRSIWTKGLGIIIAICTLWSFNSPSAPDVPM